MFLVAIGLSMDSFAVSVCNGLGMRDIRWHDYLRISVIFGLVQFIFPIIGWYLGSVVSKFISGFDHWIAFALLSYIGGKMVYESFQKDKVCELSRKDDYPRLIILAVATSIDALAVGLSFAFIGTSIFVPAIIIGIVTVIATVLGMYFGQNIGHVFESKAELIGGIVLIGIGLKILIEHLI